MDNLLSGERAAFIHAASLCRGYRRKIKVYKFIAFIQSILLIAFIAFILFKL